MEIKIKIKCNIIQLKDVVKKIKEIEKEYNVTCTLLEVEC